MTAAMNEFYGLGLAPKLLAALEQLKFTTPTPIQKNAIPIALQGQDMVGIAQTGTGKTLAFGLPMIQRLAQTRGRGLVLVPTRELAIQVEESLQKVGAAIRLKTAVLIGGASMDRQMQQLRRGPHIIIATPGRLIDHLERRTLKLDDIHVLVMDEADRMLDMGFQPQIKKILAAVPRDRQTMLFSATMPSEIVKLANQHMKTPIRVEIAAAGTAAERVTQELFFVGREAKTHLLKKILEQYKGTVLVFSRTKHGAKKITKSILDWGHTAAEIHSNKSLSQRRAALDGFKSGRYRILVATDIAARGIDVTGIELVLNFDLPDNPEDYVHRIGRTGRAGLPGHAISFAAPDQRGDVRGIERVMRSTLAVSKLPELPNTRPTAQPIYRPAQHPQRGFQPRRSGQHQQRSQSQQAGAYQGQSRRSPLQQREPEPEAKTDYSQPKKFEFPNMPKKAQRRRG